MQNVHSISVKEETFSLLSFSNAIAENNLTGTELHEHKGNQIKPLLFLITTEVTRHIVDNFIFYQGLIFWKENLLNS